MPHSAYPLDADYTAFVTGAGLSMPSAYSWVGIADYAQAEFEKRTGRIPFLKDASDVARSFDPPGATSTLETSFYKGGEKLLELDAGLLTCTSVAVGVTPGDPGAVLAAGTQYRLMPQNAAVKNMPYEWIEFYFPVYGMPSSIVITGKWGYAANLPEDVWQCCLCIGAEYVATQILDGLLTGATSIKTPTDETTYSRNVADLGKGWGATATRIIENGGYRLRRVGL